MRAQEERYFMRQLIHSIFKLAIWTAEYLNGGYERNLLIERLIACSDAIRLNTIGPGSGIWKEHMRIIDMMNPDAKDAKEQAVRTFKFYILLCERSIENEDRFLRIDERYAYEYKLTQEDIEYATEILSL